MWDRRFGRCDDGVAAGVCDTRPPLVLHTRPGPAELNAVKHLQALHCRCRVHLFIKTIDREERQTGERAGPAVVVINLSHAKSVFSAPHHLEPHGL